MKANKFSKQNEAQVGIGTMIVFIATILVAAVAAGVLIDTSQKLQDKSTRTGVEATDQVGTSLEVLDVTGVRSETADTDLDYMQVKVRLAAGATTLDLTTLKIQYRDGTNFNTYDQAVATSATEFTTTDLAGNAVTSISDGEVVLIQIGDGTDNVDLATSTTVSIDLIPEVGHNVQVGFTSPPTYGSDLVFDLF